ncbi:MAG: hypothetical protein ACRD12_24625 [Acidimicrobiales bacterium]
MLEINDRALRCYQRCGFRPTGFVPDAAVVDGVPYGDVVIEVRRGEAPW